MRARLAPITLEFPHSSANMRGIGVSVGRMIAQSSHRQTEGLDQARPFECGTRRPWGLARRIADLAPAGLDHVFFCNLGREAADAALKTALAYHQIAGQGSRTRLIGRE